MAVGEGRELGALEVTVTGAELAEVREGREQLMVHVALANETEETQPYSFLAFTVESETGIVHAPLPYEFEDALEPGTLEPGERLAASVLFDGGPGTYRVIYQHPDPDGTQRAVWTITVE